MHAELKPLLSRLVKEGPSQEVVVINMIVVNMPSAWQKGGFSFYEQNTKINVNTSFYPFNSFQI